MAVIERLSLSDLCVDQSLPYFNVYCWALLLLCVSTWLVLRYIRLKFHLDQSLQSSVRCEDHGKKKFYDITKCRQAAIFTTNRIQISPPVNLLICV